MKTAFFIGIIVWLAGCGGESADFSRDAAVDLGDACVAAQGNCGCILEETYNLVTKQTATMVVCPDGGTK